MPNSSQVPWSNNPNAPQIPSQQYSAEKLFFAGVFLKAMSYGVVIALFFWCMAALLDPVNRTKGGIKWGFVAHIVAMFLVFTMSAVLGLQTKSTVYIDNRNFHGNGEVIPGALGYRCYIPAFETIDTADNVAFPLNQWLADGLLLYRCHVIYSMNYRLTTLPCLLYIVSIALGIAFTCLSAQPKSANAFPMHLGDSYYSVSLSLSVILTLMIIARLILHRRNLRKALGVADSAGGLYTAVITMLVESYALYFVTFLLFFVNWATGNWASELFAGVLSATLGRKSLARFDHHLIFLQQK